MTTTNTTTAGTNGGTAGSKTAAALDTLAAGVASILDGDQWAAALRVAARLHSYSPNNRLLIMVQRLDATRVAGFGTWKSLGRTVRKGEKGISILAPCVIRPTKNANKRTSADSTQAAAGESDDTAATAATEDGGKARLRFRVACSTCPRPTDRTCPTCPGPNCSAGPVRKDCGTHWPRRSPGTATPCAAARQAPAASATPPAAAGCRRRRPAERRGRRPRPRPRTRAHRVRAPDRPPPEREQAPAGAGGRVSRLAGVPGRRTGLRRLRLRVRRRLGRRRPRRPGRGPHRRSGHLRGRVRGSRPDHHPAYTPTPTWPRSAPELVASAPAGGGHRALPAGIPRRIPPVTVPWLSRERCDSVSDGETQ